jgi:UDP-N-acetylmuramoyl-tripeptide--D-alanyl-D-alanine ligase
VGTVSKAKDLAHRLRRSFLYNLPFAAAATIWRRLLFRTTFIAVTGSNGKTTTKDLLAALLATRHPTMKTTGSDNGRVGLSRTILRTRPWHRFAVLEIGIDAPGLMWRAALQARPDIVVVTSVAAEHSENFSSLDVTAAEKAKLLRGLGRRGFAVLNGDDQRVREMAGTGDFRSVFFGVSRKWDLWADQIHGNWPDRMRLRVHSGGRAYEVATRLVGMQWATPVLAALLAARECGIDPAEAVPEIARLEPHPARMQPVRLPSGAVLIRDEYNGSAGTTAAAFQVLAQARAARRVVILSDVTDDHRPVEERLLALGKAAGRVAEVVIFVGPDSRIGASGAVEAGLNPDSAFGLPRLEDAVSWLRHNLRQGDLALLKGRNLDHLSRIYFALFGPVACWTTNCTRRILCDTCPELGQKDALPLT